MFFTAFRWKLIVSQIREGEMILRIIVHLFPMRHFVVQSMLKYLIAREGSQEFTSYVSLYGILLQYSRGAKGSLELWSD